MITKKELRKVIMGKRECIPKDVKDNFDQEIFKKVTADTAYMNASSIFIYVSYKSEVNTHRIIRHALENNKLVCVPKILSLSEGMVAKRINSFEDLEKGPYGILEPVNDAIIKPSDIDLILVPGLAFDLKGGRLGYGGGFYDRFLREVKPGAVKTALAYDFQILSEIPMNEMDERIDNVITN